MDRMMLNVYVLPTEENLPPRAILFEGETPNAQNARVSVWSADVGTWTLEGVPLNTSLADIITGHARSLGVDL
jgi:hypothetical protein